MAATLPPLPEIERLSSRVIRILGGNPSKFTLQGTNTYLVGQGPRRLLIDTGEGRPAWIQSLKSVLASEKASISKAILTHWHPDHIGGVPDLLSLPNGKDIQVYKSHIGNANSDWADIRDGQKFTTEDGTTLRAFHSPGHTTDHMALVLEEEDAMFTGDNVLGHGTAVFEDLTAYVKSLERMAGQFNGRGYPGHGAVIEDGKAKVLEYVKHRKEREDQIIEVLRTQKEGEQGKPKWKSMEMVKVIYKSYPENLHLPAEKGLLQVLGKLAAEGKVTKDNSDLWSLTEKAAL